ncbi:MAG: DNA-directed DNA polymerase [Candidatus Bilamarchaeaceae archaeon]
MVKRKAILLGADYVVRKGQTYVRLEVKGKKACRLYCKYDPYFYVDAPQEAKALLEKITARSKEGKVIFAKSIEIAEKELMGKPRKVFKVYCSEPAHVPMLREKVEFPCYEDGIPFGKRFLMDFGLVPLSIIRYEREGRMIRKFLGSLGQGGEMLNAFAFDIETYNPEGVPRESSDPAIMVSYCTGKERGVVTYKEVKGGNAHVEVVGSEKEMIERFCMLLEEKDADIVIGYNSTNFDFPYLKARAKKLKIGLPVGRGGTEYRIVKKGMVNPIKIPGRVHVDIYPSVRFFGFTGMIKSGDYTLEKVYAAVTGKKKKMVERLDIWKMWDRNDLEELVEYSLLDSVVTLELAEHILPIQMELSEIARMPLFDAAYATSGQLVESLLMNEAARRGILIPPKPSGSMVNARENNPIQGAYVKLPSPGIYDNIAVFDFRGLYPSIICSYNIDPDTIDMEGESWIAPNGARFLKNRPGLIPSVLGGLIDKRAEMKAKLKGLEKDSAEYRKLNARSYALKLLANSFYGYLGYARSRWYNRRCAESVTAWGRHHIMEAEKKAEEAGFKVLYMDTDSLFLLLGNKSKKDALEFLRKFNASLPGKMELELEDFYTRGVFVGKKTAEERGAKKKYALLSEDGKVKIRGFELVRRDWSSIARETQQKVLEAILREGSKEKALGIVKEVVARLREGKVPLEEVAIYTQLKKSPSSYDVMSPELSAAKKGIARGKKMGQGSIISYVITKKGKSISEKAELLEFAKDYDPGYYIDNQVLPSVMKILKELGFDEYELKHGGKQKGMNDFF